MTPELHEVPMPPDDGAPFRCSMLEDKPRPYFLGSCENPGVMSISNPQVIKTNSPLYAKYVPALGKNMKWFFLCEDHKKWVTNSLVDDEAAKYSNFD